MTYLMPIRRIFELTAAVYGFGFGTWVWMGLMAAGSEPLAWAGLDRPAQILVAMGLMAAGVVHGFGVWLNGDWRWSPMPRAAGMTVHCGFMAMLASGHSDPFSTAVYTYAFISLLLFLGLLSAISDCRTAIRQGPGIWAKT